ncbi:MAG TPA: hypothetical protein VN240_12590 [Propylenella sp.]|nr:hypothetical protein [Propylenella sp.]
MPRVRDETQKRVRDWILALPEITGKSLTRIAEEADVAVTTLTKPANNPDYKHVTSTVTIAKIVQRHGVAPPLGFEHLRPVRGLAEPEAQEYRHDAEPDLDGVIKAFIAGRANVTAWVLKTRALEHLGYMPGDIVILDLNAPWRPGDIVCAQLYNHERGRTETIWRRYEPPYLIANSTDPAFLRPLHEDSVARKGAVLMSLRSRRAGLPSEPS